MNQQQQMFYWAHMLDECFNKQMLLEGKHWPEDYVKTGINLVKASSLGQQSWYSNSYIQQDIKTFASEFEPLSHKNSNLGFFSTIVKWFITYSGTSKEKYQEFIERKLDGIIGTLQTILNDPSYDKMRDEIKQKWTFSQFEELQKKMSDEAKASSDEKMKNIVRRDDYEVIPIYSYKELHEKFGGDLTGWHGESEWCHTNGKSTYESWTKNGTQMFFVLAKKGWQKVSQPEQKPAGKDYNAYDEYGLSLIAILVDVKTGSLLNETLRWNHVIEPSYTNSGASVDKAFKNNWGDLSQAVGMDVKVACEKELRELKSKLEKEIEQAHKIADNILKGTTTIDDDTIPFRIKRNLTKIIIPDNVTNIGSFAFYGCSDLTSVTIPDSVTSIGDDAFHYCSSLASVTIPGSVTNIGSFAFSDCSDLTNMTIPDGVTSIGDDAFYNCRSLTSVTIPDSVTSIENSTFYNCTNLTSVTIPDSVTHIGNGAFSGCSGLTRVIIPDSVTSIGNHAFEKCNNLNNLIFKGKTLEEVKAMKNYPFCIKNESIIKCEDNLNENKAAYLHKYRDEEDAIPVVDMFWTIRNKLSAPQNDIDWWIKKPFQALKDFVQSYDPSNKRQRRDNECRREMMDNDAKMLGSKDGYEIWYVPTYEAMRTIGRFYKGISTTWCVASDDPSFWFENHDMSEFIVLVRQNLQHNEFDKIAIEMQNGGRRFDVDEFIMWDVENEDDRFCNDELMHYAWELFIENGERRQGL